VIAAWPSFALIASYELLMRQVRRAAEAPFLRLSVTPAAPIASDYKGFRRCRSGGR
jgi:hypothetical protein